MLKRTLIGLVGAAVILLLLARMVERQQFVNALRGVDVGLLVIGLAMRLAVMWLKSARWAAAIRAVTGSRVRYAFRSSMIGFAGNVLVPARVGELARVTVIGKHNNIGRSLALTSVGITQLFDLTALLTYGAAISYWAAGVFDEHWLALRGLGLTIAAIFVGLIVVERRPELIQRVLARLHGRVPQRLLAGVSKYTDVFVKGLGVLSSGKTLALVIFLTFAVWACETLAVYLILAAFAIPVSWLMAATLVVVLTLGVSISVTPGNLGITQAITVFLLATFAVPPAQAFAYSIVAQGATYMLIVMVGTFCLYCEVGSLKWSYREDTTG